MKMANPSVEHPDIAVKIVDARCKDCDRLSCLYNLRDGARVMWQHQAVASTRQTQPLAT